MPRQPRIQYAGAFYHVMARGDRREAIVRTDDDRKLFVATLSEVCAKTGWRIHAWVLLDNHYHLVVETPKANLVDGMKWFQNAYTRRYNCRHKLWGHLFGGRYRSILVEKGDYFRVLVDYVHLNPVRAGLAGPDDQIDLLTYAWCSLKEGYAVAPGKRPSWLTVADRLSDYPEGDVVSTRRAYIDYLSRIARLQGKEAGKNHRQPQGTLEGNLERGWYWGSEAFKEKLLKQVRSKATNTTYAVSAVQKDKDELVAERIITGAAKEGMVEKDKLDPLPSRHPVKVAAAMVIKSQTTLSNGWIAARLGMRTAANVSQIARLYRAGEISLPAHWKKWIKKSRIFDCPQRIENGDRLIEVV